MKRSKAPIISTERLQLRSLSRNDTDAIVEMLTNEEIIQTFMVPDFQSRNEAVKMFDILKQRSVSDAHFVYGVYLNDRIIGFMNDVDIRGTEIEIGYVIHPTQKNKGFATEMLSAAIQTLFSMGYSVVSAGAFEENTASRRVMEKCGMLRIAREEDIAYRGGIHHCIFYEIRNK